MDKDPDLPSSKRYLIDQVLDVSLEWARRARDRSVTVVAIELDDLGSLGGNGADELLEVVGARLAKLQNVAAVRTGDLFVLVSTAPRSRFDAFSLAERAGRAIARPIAVESAELSPSASMGVRISNACTGDGEMLLRDAEFALGEAQRRGAGQIVVFDAELHRRRTEQPLEIRMHFEPVVSLGDGHVSSYEAVLVPGLTVSFGDAGTANFERVLDELASTIATWPVDADVSFNVSPEQLLDRRFPHRVAAAAERHSIDRDRFVFEIDERRAAEDLLRMEQALKRLRDDGWRVGVDGFGTAASPLDTLALLPVRFVKIDRSLVDDADPEMLELLATITAAARSLQISTVVTGIETLPELALAIAHEFDYAQGPLFGVQISAPMPSDNAPHPDH
jgi:predicted signal transduction protein with EAL and GGDEF domain